MRLTFQEAELLKTHRTWSRSLGPQQKAKLIKGNAEAPIFDRYSSSAVAYSKDAAELPSARCDFNYDEIDLRLGAKDESESYYSPQTISRLEMECLTRSLFAIREDQRPQLVMDCIITGLGHPLYDGITHSQIAIWNNVARQTVCRRITELREEIGIEAIPESDLRIKGSLFCLSSRLVSAINYVKKNQEPKVIIDCALHAVNHPAYSDQSLFDIGRRWGVTKADIHKKEKQVRRDLNLGQSSTNKSPESSIQYAHYNCNTKKLSIPS
jgi:hypothetical protein